MILNFCRRAAVAVHVRLVCFSVLGLGVALGTAGNTHAYDENVTTYCAADYFEFCKQHTPESAEVRYCMEAHRNELSKQCVKALVDAGEVPKKYLTKKIADRE